MNLNTEIEAILHPGKIRDAGCASSPTVLSFVFDDDPHVRAVMSAGREAIPLIAQTIEKHGRELHDISLSCFVYILGKIDARYAAEFLKPHYPVMLERPCPWAAYFTARIIRSQRHLPIHREIRFTRAELEEVLRPAASGSR